MKLSHFPSSSLICTTNTCTRFKNQMWFLLHLSWYLYSSYIILDYSAKTIPPLSIHHDCLLIHSTWFRINIMKNDKDDDDDDDDDAMVVDVHKAKYNIDVLDTLSCFSNTWIYTTCEVHRNVFSIYAKSLLMTTISIQQKVLNTHQAESITHIPQNISLPSQSQRSRRVGAQFWQFVIHFLFTIACILILCYSTPSAKILH